MKVLITGGAGYVGTALIPQLLSAGHRVRVFDNLSFGGNQLLPFFRNKNFEFQKGDVRAINDVREAVREQDAIVHLAAIVGYPACRRDPKLAEEVNVGGTKNLIEATSKNQLIVFASTGSNYGTVVEVCTEETPLNPLSLYGQTKTMAEDMLLNERTAVVYRFATAFGVSPRLRLDLLINDFTYRALTQEYVVVYEKHFKRTFVHVSDMARAFCFALENMEKMRGDAFNVGADHLGYSKEEICDVIKQYTKVYVHYADVGEDADKRNYVVSYEKINKLGFTTTIDIHEGVKELIAAFSCLEIYNPYSNV